MAIDLKTLEKLLALAKKNKLAELEVEDGKSKFRIKTSIGAGQFVAAPQYAATQLQSMDAPPPLSDSVKKLGGPDGGSDDTHNKVLSPFVGTFYKAPSPEAEPYVKDGQMVKKGDVLCIVEAMKLMNEIECEVNGKVISCLAENGQPVEYGEPLFLIDPI